jgi:CheY-specific phosphatase CheX
MHMNRKLVQAIRRTAYRAFEEMGMLLPADSDGSAAPPIRDADALAVLVEFTGAGRGTMALQLQAGLASSFAANMIGQDTPPDDQAVEDAARELLNVLCGNALPEIAAGDGRFHLAPPRRINAGEYERLRRSDHSLAACSLELDGGRSEVVLCSADGNTWIKEEYRDPGADR